MLRGEPISALAACGFFRLLALILFLSASLLAFSFFALAILATCANIRIAHTTIAVMITTVTIRYVDGVMDCRGEAGASGDPGADGSWNASSKKVSSCACVIVAMGGDANVVMSDRVSRTAGMRTKIVFVFLAITDSSSHYLFYP